MLLGMLALDWSTNYVSSSICMVVVMPSNQEKGNAKFCHFNNGELSLPCVMTTLPTALFVQICIFQSNLCFAFISVFLQLSKSAIPCLGSFVT